MYGTNSRSMDYRDRRSYRRTDYNTKINRDYKVDVRNRPLPDLEMGNDSLKLRIVHSHTIIVVGVSEELSDVKVLEQDENLGRYGKIVDIQIKKSFDKKKYMVSYQEEYEAGLAFKGINLLKFKGSRWNKLKAYYSKNKFCINFLKGDKCRKYNCPFIHENLKSARFFSEGEVNASYFEDNMSETVIKENLDKIKSRYFDVDSCFKESKFFLSVDKILVELKLAKKKDFQVEGEEMEMEDQKSRRYQSESKTLKNSSQQIDLGRKAEEMLDERTKMDKSPLELIEDAGLDIKDMSFQVGKKLILDEFLELDMLIRAKRREERLTPLEENGQTEVRLPDPEELILRNNTFFFNEKQSSYSIESYGSEEMSESEFSDYGYEFEDLINFGDLTKEPSSWIIDSAPGEVIHKLENHLSWMKILSKSNFKSLKESIKLSRSKRKRRKRKLQYKKKKQKINYFYEIGRVPRRKKKKEVEKPIEQEEIKPDEKEEEKIEKEVEEETPKEEEKPVKEEGAKVQQANKESAKEEKLERKLSKKSRKSETFNTSQTSGEQNFKLAVNTEFIEIPNTRNQYFKTENKFAKLMNDESIGESSFESEKKSRKAKAGKKKKKVEQKQEVSIFAGKKARRKKKLQKKKKKKKRQKEIQEIKENSRQGKSSTHTIGSLECSTIMHNTETNEDGKSEVSDQDLMDMIPNPEDMLLPKKIGNMRKKSENVISSSGKKRARGEDLSSRLESQRQTQGNRSHLDMQPEAEEAVSEPRDTEAKEAESKNLNESEESKIKKKKKRKRKKKKKKDRGNEDPEERIMNDMKSELKDLKLEKIPSTIQKKAKICNEEEEINCEEYLPEDETDILANKINKALANDDKGEFDIVFDILDNIFGETSNEIYVEKNEETRKVVFINDKRSYAGAFFQRLYDISGVKH